MIFNFFLVIDAQHCTVNHFLVTTLLPPMNRKLTFESLATATGTDDKRLSARTFAVVDASAALTASVNVVDILPLSRGAPKV